MSHPFFSPIKNRIPENSKGQLVLSGFDYYEGEFQPGVVSYEIQEELTGMGDPITPDAASEMLKRWHTREGIPDIVHVDFGKETLLLLLSQAGCEGIRFYFCENQKGEPSLILIGLKNNRSELDGENIGNNTKRQPLIMEVGGGVNKAKAATIPVTEPAPVAEAANGSITENTQSDSALYRYYLTK